MGVPWSESTVISEFEEVAWGHISAALSNEADVRFQKELLSTIEPWGLISFPHVYTQDSVESFCRLMADVVHFLYVSGKKKVIAMGVLHSLDPERRASEFSLDFFRFFMQVYAQQKGVEPLSIIETFPPSLPDGMERVKYPKLLEAYWEEFRDLCDQHPDAAVVTTADVAHFNSGYDHKQWFNLDPNRHNGYEWLRAYVKKSVVRMLEALFEDENLSRYNFYHPSTNLGNDGRLTQPILQDVLFGARAKVHVLLNEDVDYPREWAPEKSSFVMSTLFTVRA